MTAAPHVVVAVVTHRPGIIRVTGTRQTLEFVVIHRARVGVFDDRAERRAGGDIVEDARTDLRHILFLAGRGCAVVAGCAAVHLKLYLVKIKVFSGGQSVDDNADSYAVTLSENRNFNIVTPCG